MIIMSEGKIQWMPWYIKDVRQRLGISRKDLAKILNISYITLLRWENGQSCARGLSKRNLNKFLMSQKVKKLGIKPEECGICVGGFMDDIMINCVNITPTQINLLNMERK